MKTKRLIWTALAVVACLSCEKEIDLDYRNVSPLLVAEVGLTEDRVTARLTTTRDVTGSEGTTYIDHAIIVVSERGSDYYDTLQYSGRGRYEIDYWALTGIEYCVDISIDGQHYTSTSTMHSPPVINSFSMVWKDFLTERMLFADLRLQDPPDENNYYFMHIYRNNVGYRWAVMRDTPNPGGELQQLFTCTTEREMKKGTSSDVINEGDRLRIEVRSIDQNAYDYLYSLQLMGSSGTNPIENFTNGLLGYFSAYREDVYSMVFHIEDVE